MIHAICKYISWNKTRQNMYVSTCLPYQQLKSKFYYETHRCTALAFVRISVIYGAFVHDKNEITLQRIEEENKRP